MMMDDYIIRTRNAIANCLQNGTFDSSPYIRRHAIICMHTCANLSSEQLTLEMVYRTIHEFEYMLQLDACADESIDHMARFITNSLYSIDACAELDALVNQIVVPHIHSIQDREKIVNALTKRYGPMLVSQLQSLYNHCIAAMPREESTLLGKRKNHEIEFHDTKRRFIAN